MKGVNTKRKKAKPGQPANGKAMAAAAAVPAILLIMIFILKPTITGNATLGVSVVVTGVTHEASCNISLPSGWNLISVPCSTPNKNLTFVLQNISGKYQSVHSYDSNDANDHWKSYNPDLPSWVVQDLDIINSSRGYWVRMSQPFTLNISGTFTLPNTIALEQGWNLVGYQTNNSNSPAQLFSSINSSVKSVHAYNATDSDQWKSFYTGISDSLNDLTLIVPYWGYWINTSSAANWRITG